VSKLQDLLDQVRNLIPDASPEVEDALSTLEQEGGMSPEFDMKSPPEESPADEFGESMGEEDMEAPGIESAEQAGQEEEDEEFDMSKPPKSRGPMKRSF
jgi:hypothetical protein